MARFFLINLITLEKQEHGTCWTNAAAAAIEGVYLKQYRENISIDATDLCLAIYDDEKEEGWFVDKYKLDIGAWLCQNSESAYWGNKGTYWVSYETLLNFQLIYDVTREYSDIASYDGGNENTISTGETCTVANIYHKKGTLATVGTYTNTNDQKYTIKIFDEDFENELASIDGVKDIKGITL